MITDWEAWKKYKTIPCTRCNNTRYFMDWGGNLTPCHCCIADDRLEKASRKPQEDSDG